MKRVVVAVVAGALALSACSVFGGSDASVSPTAGDIDQIEVGASDTLAPSLTWPADMEFSRPEFKVLWEGDGPALTDGQPLLLDEYVESLDDGTVLKNTYDGLPESTILATEMLGDDLYNALLNARVGTRVLSVAPPMGEFEGEPAIVAVIDVLPDRAMGTSLEPNPDLPKVTTLASGEPVIDLDSATTLPNELTIVTLVQGDGAQVLPGSYIVAQFKAVYTADGEKDGKTWKAGDIRQSTWPPEQAPFEGQVGLGKSLRAWDEGLVDQTAGSRVMLVVPPDVGYPGEGTLIYVIDILDVWNPPSEEDAEKSLDLPSPTPTASPAPTTPAGVVP